MTMTSTSWSHFLPLMKLAYRIHALWTKWKRERQKQRNHRWEGISRAEGSWEGNHQCVNDLIPLHSSISLCLEDVVRVPTEANSGPGTWRKRFVQDVQYLPSDVIWDCNGRSFFKSAKNSVLKFFLLHLIVDSVLSQIWNWFIVPHNRKLYY